MPVCLRWFFELHCDGLQPVVSIDPVEASAWQDGFLDSVKIERATLNPGEIRFP